MSDKYFIDTNIFVYAFDKTNLDKQKIANDLIKKAVSEHVGCISFQVIQEFINVSTKRFEVPLSIEDCRKYIDSVLFPLCAIFTSLELYHRSLDIMERWRFSFYDSLIIAAALQAKCSIMYSEDLQHSQKIESITICNPFEKGAGLHF
ncbi:MAG: PIN domain-containing protein [Planctomycetota bacterium]|jgi:predicted nucleic acid-binding protein